MGSSDAVLIVDDDEHIRATVRFALEKAGFRTIEAADGLKALEAFRRDPPALVILDILMPEMDGTDVCRSIRAVSKTPIIFLTSKDDEVDRVVGLELGGDDYVPKPFSPRELVTRVRAVLRRTKAVSEPAEPAPSVPKVMAHGWLKLDLDLFRVYWGETEITLTATEFALLRTLLGYPGKVYTRDELIDRAYSFDNNVSDRTVDSHIRHVRKKLEAAGARVIETVHGLGYRLGSCRPDET
jgi:two-component system OmpR family response regulator